jgi:chitodextrinase
MKKYVSLILALLLAVSIFPILPKEIHAATYSPIKTKRTFYTEQEILNARSNISKGDPNSASYDPEYRWAYDMKVRAKNKADKYFDKWGGDTTKLYNWLWDLMPHQEVPRSIFVGWKKESDGTLHFYSPVNGEIHGNNRYKWTLDDPIGRRWKVVDPTYSSSDGTYVALPCNNFKKFLESGIDPVTKKFVRANADGSLLYNSETDPNNIGCYGKGSGYGVDDGFGWTDSSTGAMYTPVAYYAHGIFKSTTANADSSIEGILKNFTEAYLYTGDVKYAKPGNILLDRIADLYPDMDLYAYRNYNQFYHNDGLTKQGKVAGMQSEAGVVRPISRAFDALFSTFGEPDVINFLKSKASTAAGANPKTSGEAIRVNVEDGFIKQIYTGIRKGKIRSNLGKHQSALVLAAVVLDDQATTGNLTKEWIEYVYAPQTYDSTLKEYTGGDNDNILINLVDRDGSGDEAAPNYNDLWITGQKTIAESIEGYEGYAERDSWNNPKFTNMFYAQPPMVMLSEYSNGLFTPQIGDSGSVASAGLIMNNKKQTYIDAFEHLGDTYLGQVVYYMNGNKLTDLHGSIFSPDALKVKTDIDNIIKTNGVWQQESVNMTGYGFAALRNKGEAGAVTRPGMWMYYGRTSPDHAQYDMLNFDIYSHGYSMAADNGYPTGADGNLERKQWTDSTIAHNSVTVHNNTGDSTTTYRRHQGKAWDGTPLHYDDTEQVKMIDVSAPHVYSNKIDNVSDYRRTMAMIKVDEDNAYAVDFFRVKGGTDHYYSFHGTKTPMDANTSTQTIPSTYNLSLTKQSGGTYAGETVSWKADDPSGFSYLKNVHKDTATASKFAVTWDIDETFRKALFDEIVAKKGSAPDMKMRLTMLTPTNDVSLAQGDPPYLSGNPAGQWYMLAHRNGSNLESLFSSIIEPYASTRYVSSIDEAVMSPANADAKALKVTLASGRVDYIVSSVDPTITYTVDGKFQFRGSFGVYQEQNGKPIYSYINDGTLIGQSTSPMVNTDRGHLQGKVVDFTKSLSRSNEVIVDFDSLVDANSLVGKYIYIDNQTVNDMETEITLKRNSVYLIEGINWVSGNRIGLNIGEKTFVKAFVDKFDTSKGYKYDIAADLPFRIPLSYESTTLFPANDLFDNDAAGSLPAGWADLYNGTGGTVTVEQDATTTNKYLKLDKTTADGYTQAERRITSANGKLIVEYDAKPGQTNAFLGAAYMRDSAGSTISKVIFDSDGFIKVRDGTGTTDESVQAYTAGTWYNIKQVLDTDTQKYDVYINGTLVRSGLGFNTLSAADYANAWFFVGNTSIGSLMVDNFKMYHPGIANHDFEMDAAGTLPNRWVDPQGGTGGIVTVELDSISGNKYLKLDKAGSSDKAHAQRLLLGGYSGELTMEYDVKVGQINAFVGAAYMLDNENNYVARIIFGDDGNIKVRNGTGTTEDVIQAYQANTWYKLKVILNTQTQTYDVYINGVLVKTGAGLNVANTANFDKLFFFVGDTSVGSLHVDNVKVFAGSPPTVPTDLSTTVAGDTQIDLSWTASLDNSGVSGYNIYRNGVKVGTSATTAYSDTGLTAGSTYTYTVTAFDSAGTESNASASVSATTTSSGGDTTAPSTPKELSASSISGSQIDLAWTSSTDNVGVAGYKVYRDTVEIGTTTTASYSDTGLNDATTYSYTVAAYDAAGNISAQSSAASATTPDVTAPSIPSGVTATAASSSQIDVSWTASSDNVGVAGYKVFRDGVQIATTATTVYSDLGLTSGITYSYTVAAYDAAGNTSLQSSAASATTPGDTTAPSVPSDVITSTVSVNQVDLTWTASTDDVGVSGYRVYRDGVEIATTTAASYSDTGLPSGTSYSYTVAAFDAAGNTSAQSSVSNVITGVLESIQFDESMINTAETTTGLETATYSYGVQVRSTAVGQYITFDVNVPVAGDYKVSFVGVKAGGGGISNLYLNGATSPIGSFDFYSPSQTSEYVTYNIRNLAAGTNKIKFEVTGINPSSAGYFMYLKKLVFEKVDSNPLDEAHILTAETSAGLTWATYGYGLQVRSTEVGQYITFNFDVPQDGDYELGLWGVKASGGGISDVYLNDGTTPIGNYDFYAASQTNEWKFLKMRNLSAGTQKVKLQVTGLNPSSSGYYSYLKSLAVTRTQTDPFTEAEIVMAETTTGINTATFGYGVQVQTTAVNEYITFTFEAPTSGDYELGLWGVKASGGGIANLYINDGTSPIGSFDFYAASQTNDYTAYNIRNLAAGIHKVKLEITEKNASSSGYYMYLKKMTIKK